MYSTILHTPLPNMNFAQQPQLGKLDKILLKSGTVRSASVIVKLTAIPELNIHDQKAFFHLLQATIQKIKNRA